MNRSFARILPGCALGLALALGARSLLAGEPAPAAAPPVAAPPTTAPAAAPSEPATTTPAAASAPSEAKPGDAKAAEPQADPFAELRKTEAGARQRQAEALASGKKPLAERWGALAGQLAQLVRALEAASALEAQAAEVSTKIVELEKQAQRAEVLVEQTEARRARALARLRELGLEPAGTSGAPAVVPAPATPPGSKPPGTKPAATQPAAAPAPGKAPQPAATPATAPAGGATR